MQSSRIGTVAMPFLVALCQDYNLNPLFCFGIMGVLAFGCVYYLPETFGRQMVDFMDEMSDPNNNQVPLLTLNTRRPVKETPEEDDD